MGYGEEWNELARAILARADPPNGVFNSVWLRARMDPCLRAASNAASTRLDCMSCPRQLRIRQQQQQQRIAI